MKIIRFVVICLLICSSTGCTKKNIAKYDIENVLNKNNPVTINIWHYYTASQKDKFDELIENFNTSEGAKYGVYAQGIRRAGNASEISAFLADALAQKLGADDIPDIFSA